MNHVVTKNLEDEKRVEASISGCGEEIWEASQRAEICNEAGDDDAGCDGGERSCVDECIAD